ncbi:MAG: hypothetical protein EOS58_18950 [Mesorhizobium sp.]|uniref:hypothetical protein n=1 Tax=Mesorhizobium sp. TaxID=1871066 RepID=UPI000FE8C40B|nr:MAG: hypothetical protein EOS58_18950 [Mesorhizobium sp.]RWD26137.1 MAG: hypothetical protein EOS22_17145 [Mesorhizobium sp.]TIT73737.1 MAG: hypothetical protein E5W60_01035 [Mesorhizobium sp.]TIT95324.1 MAG: hypothetical protein E5W59_02375 [Mesorhizobium sp.]TJW67454.1 MAG: hypothetical protein E5V29_18125 [Mesorhizobium sp.]
MSKVGGAAFERAVRAVVADDPVSAELMDAMPAARATLWREYCRPRHLLVEMLARSEPCRRFMAIPPAW